MQQINNIFYCLYFEMQNLTKGLSVYSWDTLYNNLYKSHEIERVIKGITLIRNAVKQVNPVGAILSIVKDRPSMIGYGRPQFGLSMNIKQLRTALILSTKIYLD